MITPERIAKLTHIPNSEVEQDIRDTEREISQLRGEISRREAFIADLRALLAARASAETSASLPCVWRDGCRAPAACAAKGHCDGPFGKQVDAYVRERDSKSKESIRE